MRYLSSDLGPRVARWGRGTRAASVRRAAIACAGGRRARAAPRHPTATTLSRLRRLRPQSALTQVTAHRRGHSWDLHV